MNSVVAILEDDDRRCVTMKSSLKEATPGLIPIFFEAASEMIRWLIEHQADAVLISLDHDLPIKRDDRGRLIDYGTGEVVAKHLSGLPPTCRVILHSSNVDGAFKMRQLLEPAGWPVSRVFPSDDLAWISHEWIHEVVHHTCNASVSNR